MSIELETLDQLMGDQPLSVIRLIYSDEGIFLRSIHSLLKVGDVRLLQGNGAEVPNWRWRELFVEGGSAQELSGLILTLTERGANRIA